MLAKAQELGLLKSEYEKIKSILNRDPNFTEVCIYSVMWSEHCSYKNSVKWLKKLPTNGKNVIVESGKENAGVVDIGDDLGIVFKIESHNHPSAIEPYQGAATGVGGINRDIFTMGARPIAQLNSLRLGEIKLEKTKWLLKGIVKGIGDYGNTLGIPVVGGELQFNECYNTNPLVNAMSVGILNIDKIISATAYGNNNPVFIVGAPTGKDGINGAVFASQDITENSINNLPSVQVGDPFLEKLLLEATQELSETDYLIGMQDMGAAGIICTTSEMSAKTGAGMKINLDCVPTRQPNMLPFEILLSESQERMLVVIKKGYEKSLKNIFIKWDLSCDEIGYVTNDGILNYYSGNELVARVPAKSLVLGGGAPEYDREYKEPSYFANTLNFDINNIEEPENFEDVAEFLVAHVNIASKNWATEQFDSMVGGINMSTNYPSDSGIVNIKNNNKAIALTTDCNARYVYSNPETGALIAVCEAARNITCSGGIPTAITNCLNFGNPYSPEVYWQFVGAIKGIRKACLALNIPVTGGNVSFYNQSVINDQEIAVFPTPTIGMLGVLEDKRLATTLAFKKSEDLIYIIGSSKNDISSSEYLYSFQKVKVSPPPYFNIQEELKVQSAVQQLIRKKLVSTAHDCSDGGLFSTLCEMGYPNNLGFSIKTKNEIRKDAFLFGESQGRIVISFSPDQEKDIKKMLRKLECKFENIGKVTTKNIIIDNKSWRMNINDYKKIHLSSLKNHMKD